LTSGKTDASLLEQFRIGKLAPRRELSADHPNKPQVGSDESMPGQRTLIFEQSQLLVRGISETCACHSSIPRQQAGFDRPLQLDNVGVCQQRFMSCIVGELGHADTLKQRVPPATASNPKSVDNPLSVPCSRIAQGIRRRRRSSPNAVCDCAPSLAGVFRSSLRRSSARDSRRSQGGQSQSSAPMLRVCRALRRASSTTSSENIWLYLCCSSTGFVRCSRDFSAAMVRMTVSN
jgi:hypothetical protein